MFKMSNSYKFEIDILVTFMTTTLHGAGLYGVYYLCLKKPMLLTCVFAFILHVCAMLGMTAGAHRLWSHKSYKAKLPLRVILTIFQTLSFQFSVLEWSRMHRMHHKYCDTDADPNNSSRGFFFSHIGWALVKEHPDVKTHLITPNDLYKEKLLRFQDKYYYIFLIILNVAMPIYIPTLWGESPWVAFYVGALRQLSSLHATFLINSVAHRWGTKPYDKNIRPTENLIVSFLSVGEGFHNYHHTFPWDYKTAELGGYEFNFTKLFIDVMARIGWAYDLKTVSNDVIMNRMKRTGDGTHAVWGWDDQDLSLEHKKSAVILKGEINAIN